MSSQPWVLPRGLLETLREEQEHYSRTGIYSSRGYRRFFFSSEPSVTNNMSGTKPILQTKTSPKPWPRPPRIEANGKREFGELKPVKWEENNNAALERSKSAPLQQTEADLIKSQSISSTVFKRIAQLYPENLPDVLPQENIQRARRGTSKEPMNGKYTVAEPISSPFEESNSSTYHDSSLLEEENSAHISSRNKASAATQTSPQKLVGDTVGQIEENSEFLPSDMKSARTSLSDDTPPSRATAVFDLSTLFASPPPSASADGGRSLHTLDEHVNLLPSLTRMASADSDYLTPKSSLRQLPAIEDSSPSLTVTMNISPEVARGASLKDADIEEDHLFEEPPDFTAPVAVRDLSFEPNSSSEGRSEGKGALRRPLASRRRRIVNLMAVAAKLDTTRSPHLGDSVKKQKNESLDQSEESFEDRNKKDIAARRTFIDHAKDEGNNRTIERKGGRGDGFGVDDRNGFGGRVVVRRTSQHRKLAGERRAETGFILASGESPGTLRNFGHPGPKSLARTIDMGIDEEESSGSEKNGRKSQVTRSSEVRSNGTRSGSRRSLFSLGSLKWTATSPSASRSEWGRASRSGVLETEGSGRWRGWKWKLRGDKEWEGIVVEGSIDEVVCRVSVVCRRLGCRVIVRGGGGKVKVEWGEIGKMVLGIRGIGVDKCWIGMRKGEGREVEEMWRKIERDIELFAG